MRLLSSAVLLFVVLACAALAQTAEEEAIRGVIADYDAALEAGDLDAVIAVYAEGAVLMPMNEPTAVGEEAVGDWYQSLFEYAAVDIDCGIEEVAVSGRWAFVRAITSGTMTLSANGRLVEINGNALFVLEQQNDGGWRIARYLFN